VKEVEKENNRPPRSKVTARFKCVASPGLVMPNQRIIDLQKDYCEKHQLPMFMPSRGICFCCGKDITDRITKEQASKEHVTGCPICHHSYCD
jgi:hypothetical protein